MISSDRSLLTAIPCFFHPDYELPLPEKHPFPMEKFRQAATCLEDVFPGFHPSSPVPIHDQDVETVHEATYLNHLRKVTLPSPAVKRIGLPVTPGLYGRSKLEVAGTVSAMKAAMKTGVACNLAGGTHHAFPGFGSGYCVLNDVAIALQILKSIHPGIRAMVVDTDAHQGNGTHFIYASDPEIYTYSIHVGRNFPSRKEAGSLDVPLPRWVDGRTYLEALRRSLPHAMEAFEPDFIFWIAGADCHGKDRFGQMKLTTREIDERNWLVLNWLRQSSCPVAVLFGGGYNQSPEGTGRLHARAVALTGWVFSGASSASTNGFEGLEALNHGRMAVMDENV